MQNVYYSKWILLGPLIFEKFNKLKFMVFTPTWIPEDIAIICPLKFPFIGPMSSKTSRTFLVEIITQV